MKFLKNTYSTLFASMALAVAAVGCSDELDYPHSTVEPGLPATISVNVSLPEMTPITRADMKEGLDNKVESLWIGVFNANSGKLTGSKEVTGGNMNPHNSIIQVNDIKAKTGLSYIVAVANYDGVNYSYSTDGKEYISFKKEDLENIKSYDDFKNISAEISKDGKINTATPSTALLMSGHYITKNHNDGSYIEPETVEITKQSELTGSIHLRRLISQVKFNVTYNQNNISEFQVVSYEVHNVPNQSWLFEHMTSSINVGDERKVDGHYSYQSSGSYDQLSSQLVKDEDGNENDTWSFDWWQLENKRTGLDPEDVYDPTGLDKDMNREKYIANDYYAYRELEHKDNDGTNSKQYRSLVSSKGESLELADPNNNATYVEIKVRMTMNVDEEGNKIQSGQRVVNAVYTVHLGYCEGAGKSKAEDFNCRRNSIYTYDVKINNVKDILVEAMKSGENVPGAEGTISDVSEKYVELDAHYGVYKIYLSSSDLTPKAGSNSNSVSSSGNSSFKYIIECYDGLNSKNITIDSEKESNYDSKFYQWIEISKDPIDADTQEKGIWKKSDCSKKLTKYCDGQTRNVYNIKEFKEAVDKGELKDKPGWYTIFFNEYVYDNDDWTTYVNKPERKVWIRVMENESSDKESTQYVSKYVFAQKSIQTFYGSGKTALGLERDNESYGLNLRNSFNNGKDKGCNKENGRFNAAVYVSKASNDKALSWSDNNYDWNSFIDETEFQEINAINNATLSIEADARTSDINGKGNAVALPSLNSYYKTSGKTAEESEYDPDQSKNDRKYIEAINACMNRNRDLDGDGKIDANELRWYVPTNNQLVQIILGSESLSEPIMDFSKHNSIIAENGKNMNLFIYGSNGEVIWLMEGFSTSRWDVNNVNPEWASGAPWEIRCVRNLGTNNSTPTSSPEIDDAYVKDGNIVKMTRYDSRSIRGSIIDKMYSHDVSDKTWNTVYAAFQYKVDIDDLSSLKGYFSNPESKDDGSDYGKFDTYVKRIYYQNGTYFDVYKGDWEKWMDEINPCAVYNDINNGITGWRVPNQKEIMILMTLLDSDNKVDNPSIDEGYQSASATFGHYDGNGKSYKGSSELELKDFKVMVVRNNSDVYAGTQIEYNNYDAAHFKIRCVRDWYSGIK